MPDRRGLQKGRRGSEDQKWRACSNTQPNQRNTEGDNLSNRIHSRDASRVALLFRLRPTLERKCRMPAAFCIAIVPTLRMVFEMAVGRDENRSHNGELNRDLEKNRRDQISRGHCVPAEGEPDCDDE